MNITASTLHSDALLYRGSIDVYRFNYYDCRDEDNLPELPTEMFFASTSKNHRQPAAVRVHSA